MKIVCESCGAKYSIADDRVAGKIFKIRCKKCSEVIVVRGDQQAAAAEAAACTPQRRAKLRLARRRRRRTSRTVRAGAARRDAHERHGRLGSVRVDRRLRQLGADARRRDLVAQITVSRDNKRPLPQAAAVPEVIDPRTRR